MKRRHQAIIGKAPPILPLSNRIFPVKGVLRTYREPHARDHEPTAIPTGPTRAAAKAPDHLIEILIDNAMDAGRNARPGWSHRADGWTPRRILMFLGVLAEHGNVAKAARAAAMSVRSAYALRKRSQGGAFDRAWQMAVSSARSRPERITSRTLDGCVVPIFRGGKLWGERHRPDNRGAMSTLKRLDRLAASVDDLESHLLVSQFDTLVEIACSGGENTSGFVPSDSPARAARHHYGPSTS